MDTLAKTIKWIGLLAGGLIIFFFGSFYILRFTGYVSAYRISASAMYPTLKDGDLLIGSRSVKADRGSLYCFSSKSFGEDKKMNIILRIAGIPGDTCELREGKLYVNGKMQDIPYSIALPYFKIYDSIYTFQKITQLQQKSNFLTYDEKVYLEFLPEAEGNNQHLTPCNRYLDSLNVDTAYLYDPDKRHWSMGNYGPVVVPVDEYFMLGDNRYNAYDSRFFGFVARKDMKHGVIFIFN